MELLLSPPRLIVERCPASGEEVLLSGEETAHARARRLAVGSVVVLMDGSGVVAEGRLTRFERRGARVVVEAIRKESSDVEPIELAVGAVRVERLSWIVEKATELGVSRVAIVRTARTQSFRSGERLTERLGRIAREAAKQCGSARWPDVCGPIPLTDALRRNPDGSRFFFDPEGEAFPSELCTGFVTMLIGPEGGWTDEEYRTALAERWSRVRLPAGKLRSETAALAAVVLARAAMERGRRGREA